MNNYNDIIYLPHHISRVHKPMSISNRAAIFAPFAALTGYGEAIYETGRITDTKIDMSDEDKYMINDKLLYIQSIINERPSINIKYFTPDSKKDGGKYVEIECKVKRIDNIYKQVILDNNKKINIDDILSITFL